MRDAAFRKFGPNSRALSAQSGTLRTEPMEPEEERFPDLPNELWIHVLFQGGPALLSPCSRLCKQLHQGISEREVASELHRYFAQECYPYP